MSIGSSGRIVIEVEPTMKRELYAALVREGSTLKEWFVRNAQAYLTHSGAQLSLSLAAENTENSAGKQREVGSAVNNQMPLAIPRKS